MKHTPPPSLDSQGTRIWEKWIEQVSDLELLENYCIAYQTMVIASKSVTEDGLILPGAEQATGPGAEQATGPGAEQATGAVPEQATQPATTE